MAVCEFPSSNEACALSAPSSGSTFVLCNHGAKVITMYYQYQNCTQDYISQWQNDSGLFCSCIDDPFEDCRAIMFANRTCESAFLVVITIQLLVITIGIALNSIVVYSFLKKPSIRKKIPNILLFMQGLVDFSNCLIYALPSPVFLILQKKLRIEMSYMLPVEKVTLVFSATSSLLLFFIIAAERFLSLYKPIWHRLKIHARHIWKAATLALALSIVTSGLTIVTKRYDCNDMYVKILQALLYFFFALLTILYAWSFKLAYDSRSKGGGPNQREVSIKRDLRLVLLFVSMYLIFIVCFVPLMKTAAMDEDFYNVHTQVYLSIFTLSSVLNPLLTIWLKGEFRVNICRRKSNVDRTVQVEMNESSNVI